MTPKDSIELLKRMINTPSLSKEEKEVADIIELFFINKNISVKRYGNNLLTVNKLFDEKKKNIVLNSHIDTVKPVSGWEEDPYSAIESENKIIGLGSNDAGASVVSLINVFINKYNEELPYNLILLISCEEEISGKNGITSVLKYLPEINIAIVGEPTNMEMAVAEKGLMVLDCTSHGKAGHAARNEGENAIYKALKDIEWFRDYSFDKKSEFLGEVKMNVTQIEAGTQHNVIPDTCKFVVDVRSNELYSNQEILDIVKQNVSCDVKERSTRLSSTQSPLNHPLVNKSKQLNINVFGSHTLSDQSLMSFPSVKIGPGKSERSHTAGEFIYINEIEEAINIYNELLDDLII